MTLLEKLMIPRETFEHNLNSLIYELNLDLEHFRLFILLQDGIKIYIRYNNYNQYSYNVIFSDSELDRCRFDNFDETWENSTQPHHFHPRLKKEGEISPMDGSQEHDISLLCNLIKTQEIYSPQCEFSFKE